MSPKIKNFPAGKWLVLFGGHIQLGTAPVPEQAYYVPLVSISEEAPSSALKFMYAKAGLGDLPLITPGSVFQDGECIEVDPHERITVNMYTGKEARRNERTLDQFLEVFTADSDLNGYFQSLRLAAQKLTALASAPLVGFQTSDKKMWVVAPAAEWYRQVYGRSDYLAHTFLMPTFEDIENRLVVIERTGMIPRIEIDHPLLPNVDEVLAVVPRTKVPDRCVPLYASIKLGDLAQRNALYAAQSIRAYAADGRSEPYWLRFGHPYPDNVMQVTGRGIKGTVTTTDKDAKQKTARVIFFTSVVRHTYPPDLLYCILERENDGSSLARVGGDKPLPCDESEIRIIPRFEAVADCEHEVTTFTPDANPRAGQVAAQYEGAPFDDTGAPPIIKLERTGLPDPSLIRRVQKHDVIIDSGEKTTNQMESVVGEAGPASVELKTSFEIENAHSLASLLTTLNSLKDDGEIHDLRPVNYFPSDYSINGIILQYIPSSSGSERWLEMPERDFKRLILAVRFIYQNSLFFALDAERKGSESFSFLLARCSERQAVDDETLYANVKAAAEKLLEAKGILGNAGIADEFLGVQVLKHQKEVHHGIARVRRSYILGKMDSLIAAFLSKEAKSPS
ncbi:MAG: hypothetical protein ACTHWH_17680 [Marinobacter sp.]